MESYVNSMNDKALNSKAQTEDNSPEESSWTFYIQDFSCDNVEEHINCFSSGYGSPSMASDAASSAAKKAKNGHAASGFSCRSKSSSFKRQKAKKAAAMDEDLEDTASSPVNSPKVSYTNHFELKQGERAAVNISDQGKINDFIHNNNNGLAAVGAGDRDMTELKKRGLCVVPLSTIGSYLADNFSLIS